MQTHQALSVLRGAVRELGASQPGTPTAGGGGLADAAPSNAHLLLQISALHKAFLLLSEAFMEDLNGRQSEQEERRQALQSVRRECGDKLEVAAALQSGMQHLAAADGQLAQRQAGLAQRCGELEREVAQLRRELQQRDAELESAVERVAARQLAAAEQRWQQAAAPAAAEAATQRWAGEALPRLLQPTQAAVAAATELSAGLAADVASLAGQVEDLCEARGRAEAADANHEERLRRLEEAGMQAPPPVHSHARELEQLSQQVQALQEGQAQLDGRLSALHQRQAAAAAPAAEQPWRLRGDAAADPPATEEQLAAVVEQQAQQARTTEQLVGSVTTDVMALARHTKALDREVRSLRRETQHTQQALLQSCSVFSRALAIPSPVGPFTSLPPQL